MASYDAEIRVKTSLDNKNFEIGSEKIQHSLDDIEKGIVNTREKMKSLETLGIPKDTKLYQSAAKDLAKWTAELEAVKGKQDETASSFSEHINLMRVDIEEYAAALKQLEKEGKYFGDADYDKTYRYWKDAVDGAKKYQAELNKQTDKGKAEEAARVAREAEKAAQLQAKEAEKAARELERQEAAQRRIESLAERNLQRENAALLKEAQKEAKLQEQAAEEQRLADIKSQVTVSDQKIVDLLERKRHLAAEIAELEKAGITAGYKEHDARKAELKDISAKVSKYTNMRSTVSYLGEAAGKVNRILNAISSTGNRIGKSVGGAFRRIGTAAKRFFSSTQAGAKKTGGIMGTLASRFKGIALSLLLFNWVSKGFNAMVSGMKKGFENLMKYSGDYANSVQSLKNAQATLGNSFAAAFAPIIQTVIPYLVELINWVNRAVNALGQLFAYLSGKSTWTKATQIQGGYTDALNGTADAAKKAAGALAKFDDLDVLQKKEEPSGGGADAGGAGDMFEEVPISDGIKDFWDKLKKMWDKEDFYELGKMLADKINDMLESIDWEKVRETARRLGKSLATFLNGFIENLEWSLLGHTIAQGLNTAFEFAYGFVSNFNWTAFGTAFSGLINGFIYGLDWDLIYNTVTSGIKGVADSINAFVETLDWKKLARTLANGINVAITGLITFLDNVNWKKLGEKIGEFLMESIRKIDWKDIGRALGKIVQNAFDFLSSIVDELDFGEIFEALKDVIDGFAEETRDIPDWVKKIAEAFVIFAAAAGAVKLVTGLSNITKALSEFTKIFSGSNIIFGIKALAGGAASLGEAASFAFPHLSSFIGLLAANWQITLAASIAGLVAAVWKLDDKLRDTSAIGQYANKLEELSETAKNVAKNRIENAADAKDGITTAFKDEEREIGELADKYFELKDKTNKTAAEKALLKTYSDNLIQRIPELSDCVNEETGYLDVQRDTLAALIKKTKEYYRVEAARSALTTLYKDQIDGERNLAGAKKSLAEAQEKYNEALKAYQEWDPMEGGNQDGLLRNLSEAKSALDSAQDSVGLYRDALDSTNDSIHFVCESLNESQDALDRLDFADAALSAANAVDKMHGVWSDGKQILGQDAIDIYNEIKAGLEPDENGFYTLASGQVVQYGQALSDNKDFVKVSADAAFIQSLNEVLPEGYDLSYQNGLLAVTAYTSALEGGKEAIRNSIIEAINGDESIYEEVRQRFAGYAAYSKKGWEEGLDAVIPETKTSTDNWARLAITDPMKLRADTDAKELGQFWTQGLANGIGDRSANGEVKKAVDGLGKDTKDATMTALEEHSPSAFTKEAGRNWVLGLNSGIEENAPSTLQVITAWINSIKESIPIDMWAEAFANILPAFQTKWAELAEWWSAVAMPEFFTFMNEGFFSVDSWLTVFDNIRLALVQKWDEMTLWLNDEALPTWWTDCIEMWFAVEKWLDILDNVRIAHEEKWKEIFELIQKMLLLILEEMKKKQKVMSDDWRRAMDLMEEVAHNAFENIRNDAETAIDAIIDKIGELSSALSGISGQFSSIGSMGVSASSYRSGAVPSSYMLDNIPHLASGSVIRGGNPFLAVLGDQRSGQTNVEAPAGLIKDMVKAGIAESGLNIGGGQLKITMNVNGADLAQATLQDFLNEMNRQGLNVEVLGV